MVTHMKTTVEIADHLLQRARAAASAEGVTLRQLVEEGLREILEKRARDQVKPFRLRPIRFCGGGFVLGFEAAGWDAVRDEIYRGRGA